MGRYGIVVVGVGAHHNPDNAGDAEKLAHQFVNRLRAAGHNVEIAQIEIEGGAGPEALQHDVELKPSFFGPTAPCAAPAVHREPTIADQAEPGNGESTTAPAAETAAAQ